MEIARIVEAARKAREHAYAPYSKFKVGAAVLTKSGRIFSGANVENAAYPLTRCAEQIAVGAMVAAGEREIALVVVYTGASPPATPCGACRQVIAEFAGPETPILCVNDKGEEVRYTLGELLPASFTFSANST